MEQGFQKLLSGFLLVGTGSFLGGGMRFLIDKMVVRLLGSGMPWGTWVVNILGCFLLGLFFSVLGKNSSSGNLSLILTTGFCGGFTTFSTYVKEGFLLCQQNQVGIALLYILGSLVVGMLFFYIGFILAR